MSRQYRKKKSSNGFLIIVTVFLICGALSSLFPRESNKDITITQITLQPTITVTATPSPTITNSPTATVKYTIKETKNEQKVYVSSSGKYHSKSNCSGMKNYTTMKLSEAKKKGYKACSKCN